MNKPMLASDWDESKVHLPAWLQPKIDGVRGLNRYGGLEGRSLKKHANRAVTAFFSHPAFVGLDGELAAGPEAHPDLCRMTTSALSTITGDPYVVWHVFDFLTVATLRLPYKERYAILKAHVGELQECRPDLGQRLKLVPCTTVTTLTELEAVDDAWLAQGYEGSIIRDPYGAYKSGRSTVREGGLLRIKRFIEEEAIVVSITEGQENGNDAVTNELGYTSRSSHQCNMVPNGMVGSLECALVKDVVYKGKLLFLKGQQVTVSAGSMPHDERVRYFREPGRLIGKVIKFKTFPKGVKDKPRFPTFQSIRVDSDM